jgi:hypothetical protein
MGGCAESLWMNDVETEIFFEGFEVTVLAIRQSIVF